MCNIGRPGRYLLALATIRLPSYVAYTLGRVSASEQWNYSLSMFLGCRKRGVIARCRPRPASHFSNTAYWDNVCSGFVWRAAAVCSCLGCTELASILAKRREKQKQACGHFTRLHRSCRMPSDRPYCYIIIILYMHCNQVTVPRHGRDSYQTHRPGNFVLGVEYRGIPGECGIRCGGIHRHIPAPYTGTPAHLC